MKSPLPPLHALGSELTEVCSPYPGHLRAGDGETKTSKLKKVSTSTYWRGYLGHCIGSEDMETIQHFYRMLQNQFHTLKKAGHEDEIAESINSNPLPHT